MKINKLYFFSKDIICFLLFIIISLSIFFSNKSIYVQKIETKIVDFIAFILRDARNELSLTVIAWNLINSDSAVQSLPDQS